MKRRISANDAAKLIDGCVDELRLLADVKAPNAQSNAVNFVFNRMLVALSENARTRGLTSITKSYAEWAALASLRGAEKLTVGASLRKPFREWKRSLARTKLTPNLCNELEDDSSGSLPPNSASLRGITCEFLVETPGLAGRGKSGGQAGLKVAFGAGKDTFEVLPPPTIATEIGIDRELALAVREKHHAEELGKARRAYLVTFEFFFGHEESTRLEGELQRKETHARARWLQSATMFLLVVLFFGAGGGTYAAYRKARERMRQTFVGYFMGIGASCDGERPFVYLSFSTPGYDPPFDILRDDVVIGTVTARADSKQILDYMYDDYDVEANRNYVYRFGKRVWSVGEIVTSSSYSTTTPQCRQSSNHVPTLGEITTSKSPIGIGEEFEMWIPATDPDGDPLSYEWAFPDGSSKQGPRVRARFDSPGRHDIFVIVSDGGEPDAVKMAWVPVSAMNPNNRAPILTTLLATPARARPGERVRLFAPAGDPDGDPLQYEWELGSEPGITSRTERAIEFSYEKPGVYRPSVVVIDASLATVRQSAMIVVEADAPPSSVRCSWIDLSPDYRPGVGEERKFSVVLEPDSSPPSLVEWDFGDSAGLARTESSSTHHRYSKAGKYTVSALVRHGKDFDICQQTKVEVGLPTEADNAFDRYWGTAEPTKGTTSTLFSFRAKPYGNERDFEYRWELHQVFSGAIIETSEWSGDTTFETLIPKEGLWDVQFLVRHRKNNGQNSFRVGYVLVVNPKASTPAPSSEPEKPQQTSSPPVP